MFEGWDYAVDKIENTQKMNIKEQLSKQKTRLASDQLSEEQMKRKCKEQVTKELNATQKSVQHGSINHVPMIMKGKILGVTERVVDMKVVKIRKKKGSA